MKAAMLIKRPIDAKFIVVPIKNFPGAFMPSVEAWVNAVIVPEYEIPRDIRPLFLDEEKEDSNVDG